MAQRIQSYVKAEEASEMDVLNWALHDERGQATFHRIWRQSAAAYPELADELLGVAQGAEVEPELLRLFALLPELRLGSSQHALAPRLDDACTDIHVKDGNITLLGHNEDAASAVQRFAYIVEAQIGLDIAFTSYTYPGNLPGNAWSFNEAGVVLTLNAVFPSELTSEGVARNFVSRSLLTQSSRRAMTALARQNPIASGFSMNLGDSKDTAILLNVEVAGAKQDVYEVQGNYSHVNMYRRLAVRQEDDASSLHRLRRLQELPAPSSEQDVRALLGDHHDSEYPIYRNGSPPDTDLVTACTIIFNLGKGIACLYLENPHVAAPAASFDLQQSR
eukprot:CAMPEP_0170575396 /NCGR_PEP_ID=MMETSP0224-20130122/3841_1 /TAXON_ID=285029 /ORGANISM="Togula jolla, Strain CCCM 725" /LENGTH=332 /DNA_ID=CAMNT_0010898177 /DNA_START=20 /DNA_END=1015 /DNA_ORIENTATION=+